MIACKKELPQGLLFSEPLISDTGIWCELGDEINPREWAAICQYVGSLSSREFRKLEEKVYGNPDSLRNRFKRIFCFKQSDCEGLPLVKIGQW